MIGNFHFDLQYLTHVYHYGMLFVVMLVGLLIVISSASGVKKLLGLNIFQSSVILLYVSFGYINDSIPPIMQSGEQIYANPLPQVLMLTAIVVGIATLTLGLTFVVMISKCEHHEL